MSSSWYEVAGPDVRLTQGDLIHECPLLKWQLDDAAEGESKASGERLFKAAKGIKVDVVVMTQACDLEQGKVSDVVLCPCRPLSRYKPVWEEAERLRQQNPTNKAWTAFCEDIKNGYVWNLFMMDSLQEGEITTEHRIVDFHSVHTVPRAFLRYAARRARGEATEVAATVPRTPLTIICQILHEGWAADSHHQSLVSPSRPTRSVPGGEGGEVPSIEPARC